MKTTIFCAGSDLGVHINGTQLGPTILFNNIKNEFNGEAIYLLRNENIIKSNTSTDKRKNEKEIENFNTKLYQTIIDNNDNNFPLLLGGDHSVAVASALASAKKNGDIGIIWIDAHADYNTFETTMTGNIHGLPLAAITGFNCQELRHFHHGETISPNNAVIVGARSIDELERENIKRAGITLFTTDDIKKYGVKYVMAEAFKIASNNTKGIHISYDLDIIDPITAPGVSIPEVDGINEIEAFEICNEINKNISKIVSFDLVEFNPILDRRQKTEEIATILLTKIIKAIESKTELVKN